MSSHQEKELSSVFFPERMDFVKFVCPLESAYYLIKGIAKSGTVQLIDHNRGDVSTPKRHSDTYMQCEEAERSLRFIEEQLKINKDSDGKSMLPAKPTMVEARANRNDFDLSELLQHISEDNQTLREKVQISQQMTTQLFQRKTKLQALIFYRPIVEKEHIDRERETSGTAPIELSILDETHIVSSVTGFVQGQKLHKMITMIYRVSRRNVVYHTGDANSNNEVPFTIFASSSLVLSKIKKICESFTSNVFDFPGDSASLQQMQEELEAEIRQMESVETQTAEINIDYLKNLARTYWNRRIFIAQEKQIWIAMDYGDYQNPSVIYKGWCPRRLVPDLKPIIDQAKIESGSPVEIALTNIPAEDVRKEAEAAEKECVIPSYIEKNDFTSAFQMLNDAYGIPDYDELNGGAFYCMYPFLFAIMFGDIGHSIFYILAAIALLVVDPIAKKKDWDLGEMGSSIFKFKWLLFFAAICSLYCGFIYNECFGLPISIFHPGWVYAGETNNLQRWTRRSDFYTYPFGIDFTWYFKDNELIFLNSYKMKLAVCIGMVQMFFGMFLQLINHIHRKSVYSIIVTWIPQVLYLFPFFGYMVFIIIRKWTIDFDRDSYYTDPDVRENGVNLIQVLIGMILSFGKKETDLDLYDGCFKVQTVIVVIFFISIPLLLFLKPICECIKMIMRHQQISIIEIFVMNLINVIEFCLSALSHTASYLRLWALSLAHSQLSHVIYEELFVLTLNQNNVFFVWIGWAAFAALSAAILLAMEAFSALLHAIRLMWVEFSSKFYEGMGVKFAPLSLKKALKKIGIN